MNPVVFPPSLALIWATWSSNYSLCSRENVQLMGRKLSPSTAHPVCLGTPGLPRGFSSIAWAPLPPWWAALLAWSQVPATKSSLLSCFSNSVYFAAQAPHSSDGFQRWVLADLTLITTRNSRAFLLPFNPVKPLASPTQAPPPLVRKPCLLPTNCGKSASF